MQKQEYGRRKLVMRSKWIRRTVSLWPFFMMVFANFAAATFQNRNIPCSPLIFQRIRLPQDAPRPCPEFISELFSTKGRETQKERSSVRRRGDSYSPKKTIQERPLRPPKSARVSWYSDPSLEIQLEYARKGHTVLRGLIDPKLILNSLKPKLIKHARSQELMAWKQKVEVAAGPQAAASCKTVSDCQRELEKHFGEGKTPPLPFLQYFNNWRCIAEVEALAKSEQLVHTAATLMNVPTVRLYQDSLFWKRSGDGATPWHVDARMAPFDTTNMVTFWIPLHDMSSDESALVFCSGSHADFALPYWNPVPKDGEDDNSDSEWLRLEERYGDDSLIDYLPLRIGDVTAHSGWTLHCADEKLAGTADRIALAISYVDGRAPIRRDAAVSVSTNSGYGDNEDAWSYREWVDKIPPMKRNFRHKLVPIVWPVKR